MGDLSGQRAIVTGAAQGAGASIARAFARAGARLVVADRDSAALARIAADLDAHAVPVDMGDSTSVGRLAYAAFDYLEEVDIFVHADPVPRRPTAPGAEPLDLIERHFLPAMKAAGRGVILLVAPPPDLQCSDGRHRTDALATELAAFGLRLHLLNPVPRRTGPSTSSPPPIPPEIGTAAVFLCSDAASKLGGPMPDGNGDRSL